jgi:hypothetical protein
MLLGDTPVVKSKAIADGAAIAATTATTIFLIFMIFPKIKF